MRSIYSWLNIALIKNINRAGIFNLGGHFLLADMIDRNSNIIDLGANKGRFYSFMYDSYHCKCYAVEAAPDLFEALVTMPDVFAYNYAISKENGFAEFHLSNESEANSLQPLIASNWGIERTVTVPTITLERFLSDQGLSFPIDLLKIDIEGAELDVINGSPAPLLKGIKQIAVEFHDFLDLTTDYKKSMLSALKKLKENNFLVIRFSSYDNREILCINNDLVNLSLRQKIRLRVIHPILRNLKLSHTVISRFYK